MITKTHLDPKDIADLRRIIKEKTGYTIASPIILNQIFTRSSLAAETGQNSNEIFEFLGDQILNFNVVKSISSRFGALSLTDGYMFRIRENKFTLIKQALINNDILSKIIDEWDIAKYLLLSVSDAKNEVAKGTKVKADLFEAILGAIAIESNWDADILEKSVTQALNLESKITNMIESDTLVQYFDIDSAIMILKELAESGMCTMPKYNFSGPEYLGYDSNGNPRWSCTCIIVNEKTGITRCVDATYKKDAKKSAAYLVLCEHLNVQNKYGPNDWYISWTYKNGKLFPNRQTNNQEIL